MTEKKFYQVLTEVVKDPDWRVKAGQGTLRLAHKDGFADHCPITAVGFYKGIPCKYSTEYLQVGTSLGLNYQLIRRIIHAADSINKEPKTRAALLKACQL